MRDRRPFGLEDVPSEDFDSEYPAIPEVMRTLQAELPGIAADLIKRSQDLSDTTNQTFAASPDDTAQHAPKWHQYGILTHSYEFSRVIAEEVPAYLESWGLAEPVNDVLSSEIDGVPRQQLLPIASLLHDLGKFSTRRIIHKTGTDTVSFDFTGHEEDSGRIVRSDMREDLQSWGLTAHQVDYLARCAELHFELGKVRHAAKEAGGYTMRFVDSPSFITEIDKIIKAHPDFAVEIGILFIADSLSKTEVSAHSSTDEAIAQERPRLETELTEKDLNPKLIEQALQQPVNLRVARKFLETWATSS